MSNTVSRIFSPSGSHIILVFRTKRHGDVPLGTLLTRASIAGVVGTSQISRNIWLDGYQINDWWSAINKTVNYAVVCSNSVDDWTSIYRRDCHASVNLVYHSPPRPFLVVLNVTAHPSLASVPITVLLYNGSLLCGFNVGVKGLTRIFRGEPFSNLLGKWP